MYFTPPPFIHSSGNFLVELFFCHFCITELLWSVSRTDRKQQRKHAARVRVRPFGNTQSSGVPELYLQSSPPGCSFTSTWSWAGLLLLLPVEVASTLRPLPSCHVSTSTCVAWPDQWPSVKGEKEVLENGQLPWGRAGASSRVPAQPSDTACTAKPGSTSHVYSYLVWY